MPGCEMQPPTNGCKAHEPSHRCRINSFERIQNLEFRISPPIKPIHPNNPHLSMKTSKLNPLGASKNAFTLLELLVVVSTILVVATLVLPAASRVKTKALEADCLSNLRQLGIAISLYAEEHENRLPAAEQRPTMPVDPNHPLPRICDALAPQIGGSNSVVFRCPQDRAGFFQSEGSSYEWAYLVNGKQLDAIEVGPSFARFTIPSDQVP